MLIGRQCFYPPHLLRAVMGFQFLNFEDTTIKIGGKTLFATSASMDITPQIQADRVYGEFDSGIAGTKTKLHRQAPVAPIEGRLNVSFYITKEFFNANPLDGGPKIDSIFDVRNVTESPIVDNRIGRYIMGDLYLDKFDFSLKPFGVAEANASYLMTGTLYRDRPSIRIPLADVENFDPAHALRCFAVMKAGDENMQTIEEYPSPPPSHYSFEIMDLNFSINVERNKSALIRSNENTIINTRPEGAEAVRVSVNNMESSMKIKSNDLVDRLNPYGEYQPLNSLPVDGDSSIAAYLYSINGTRLAKFNCDGKVMSQSLNVNKDGMTTASIEVKQILR
jgi:hypothetical protein